MEVTTYLQFVLALVFVLALIGLVAFLVRRFGLAGSVQPPKGGRRRLAVVEALSLDPKRRLLLLRRDGVEHLVLLGGAGEVVVETGIEAASRPLPPPTAAPGQRADFRPELRAEPEDRL